MFPQLIPRMVHTLCDIGVQGQTRPCLHRARFEFEDRMSAGLRELRSNGAIRISHNNLYYIYQKTSSVLMRFSFI